MQRNTAAKERLNERIKRKKYIEKCVKSENALYFFNADTDSSTIN